MTIRTFRNKKTSLDVHLDDSKKRDAKWIEYYENNENYVERVYMEID